MSEGIAELDELHTAADSVLTSVREMTELAHQVADRSIRGKPPTKAQQKAFDRVAAEYRTRSVHYADLVKKDRFIKVWYLLLDTFQQAHQAESPKQDCPVWWLIEETDASHCHDALSSVMHRLGKAVPRFAAASLERLSEAAGDDRLDVVTGELFAKLFNGEYDLARQFLSHRSYEPYPLSATMRLCAQRKILWQMNYHALGCAELAHRFVESFCTTYYWSSNERKAGIQAEDRWERVESATLNLTKHASRFREVPDESVMLDTIRKANVDDLREIPVHNRTFATAHEAIDSIDYVVDDIVESLDCFTDEDRVVELAEALKHVEIPDLTARLLIEKERTENWLELQFEKEEALEKRDEAAVARRRTLDTFDQQIEELEADEDTDGDSTTGRQRTGRKKKARKRKQGRPSKSDDPDEKELERRFWSVYKQTKSLSEACRECHIDEKYGKTLQARLRTREYRDRVKAEQKRRESQ